MSGEALFKSIVSGEDQSVLGDIARSSLGLLSKGYEKAVSIRNARFDEGKGVTNQRWQHYGWWYWKNTDGAIYL